MNNVRSALRNHGHHLRWTCENRAHVVPYLPVRVPIALVIVFLVSQKRPYVNVPFRLSLRRRLCIMDHCYKSVSNCAQISNIVEIRECRIWPCTDFASAPPRTIHVAQDVRRDLQFTLRVSVPWQQGLTKRLRMLPVSHRGASWLRHMPWRVAMSYAKRMVNLVFGPCLLCSGATSCWGGPTDSSATLLLCFLLRTSYERGG